MGMVYNVGIWRIPVGMVYNVGNTVKIIHVRKEGKRLSYSKYERNDLNTIMK